jgi:type I restriction enzyme S subunit
VRNGWEKKTLGEVAELRGRIGWRGLTAKEYTAKGPLFLSVHSLNYGDFVDFRDAFHISDKRYEESPEIMLQKDDVLICKDGAGIGKTGIIGHLPNPATINSSLLLVRAGSSILPKFLYRCLESPYFQSIVQSRLNGATTPHLYQRDIAEFPVVLPPLPEQRRIVAILDEAFEGIAAAKASAETNLRNAKSVLLAHLSEVFTSGMDAMEMAPVKEIAHHCLGKMLDRNKNRGTPRPYLRNINVRWFTFDLEDVSEMRFEKDEETKFSARQGDLLICEGGYPGRAAVWNGAEPMFIQKAIHRVRFHNRKYTNWFLYYLFWLEQTGRLRRYCTGTGILHFTGKSLAELPVPLPSDSDADRHSRTFEQLRTTTNRACETLSRKLSALDELKASLLHQAFTGQL